MKSKPNIKRVRIQRAQFTFPTVFLTVIFLTMIARFSEAKKESASGSLMAEAARNFIASLSADQRAKAVFPFESDERMNWHYIPKPRKGLPIKEMDQGQSHLAHALLNSALSARGFIKAETIMSLEPVLRNLESSGGKATPVRDADLYYFSIFGDPAPEKPWGWRIEGHHVSLNFTVVNGDLTASSPAFFGANPHEVREGPRKGLRVLGAEEDLGRELVKSLDESQRKQAIIGDAAPPDIFTRADRKAQLEGPPKGLPRSAMNDKQKEMLQALMDEYIDNLHPMLARDRRAKLEKLTPSERDQIFFAWMGGTEKGQGHYYRVQAPTFLIEYDNTADNANHSHTVWRDFNGDFGFDLLAEHHKLAH